MKENNKMKIELITYTKDYKSILYQAGRSCYGLKNITEKDTPERMSKFITSIIKMNHQSVLEHCIYTLNITNVSRSLMAQMTRSRFGWSFNIYSQHYCDHSNFKYKELEDVTDEKLITEYHQLMKTIDTFYSKLCDNGVKKWIAREVLPNATLTDIFVTFNARALRHFLKQRITSNNCPEIILLSKEIVKLLYKLTPEIVQDYYEQYIEQK